MKNEPLDIKKSTKGVFSILLGLASFEDGLPSKKFQKKWNKALYLEDLFLSLQPQLCPFVKR